MSFEPYFSRRINGGDWRYSTHFVPLMSEDTESHGCIHSSRIVWNRSMYTKSSARAKARS